jgi:hypothetical protein
MEKELDTGGLIEAFDKSKVILQGLDLTWKLSDYGD